MRAEEVPGTRLVRVAADAAGLLAGENGADSEARQFLQALGYLDGDVGQTAQRVAMLRAAGLFRRLFFLPAPDAPGAVAAGGEIDAARLASPGHPIASVAGFGLDAGAAFEACVGEGIEQLSLYARPDTTFIRASAAQALARAPEPLSALWRSLMMGSDQQLPAVLDWVRARSLHDDAEVLLPADLCFLRSTERAVIRPGWPISCGCAAAHDRQTATLRGLLELVERDAVALWWCGGTPGRALPAEDPAVQQSGALLARLRRGAAGRQTWLLDITSDLHVPVVAALSTDADGGGLCLGSAAGPSRGEAARRAVLELCQMELGARIDALKPGAVPPGRQLACYPIARPAPPPRPPQDLPQATVWQTLQEVLGRLRAQGLSAYAVELTQLELGVAAMRVVCPGLQPAPAPPVTRRLAQAAARNGQTLQPFPKVPFP